MMRHLFNSKQDLNYHSRPKLKIKKLIFRHISILDANMNESKNSKTRFIILNNVCYMTKVILEHAFIWQLNLPTAVTFTKLKSTSSIASNLVQLVFQLILALVKFFISLEIQKSRQTITGLLSIMTINIIKPTAKLESYSLNFKIQRELQTI